MFVLDTNILVAGLWSSTGASNRILQQAVRREFQYAVSVALVLEYEAVLKRARMREASWASAAELDGLLDALVGGAERIMPIRTRLRPAARDPDDDMLIECAVQAGAEAIVTMNVRDLRSAAGLFHIDLLGPAAFLVRLREGEME